MKHFTKLYQQLVWGISHTKVKFLENAEFNEKFYSNYNFNKKNNDLDSFYDQDCNYVCKDENGILYSVMFHHTGIPIIWQKCEELK